ncbi:ATP-binding cassette domain-containing protein [Brevibacillus dissolubilis]|uniref:ATP-binding cassette domain-containing protein n=1 Tax=Brevibacillus dissolubilis TaxID=1844116 RepID=UPI0011171BB7|nr:ABC transporter ATP-binding protein [Brevibacillus dissolubilis]
MATINAIIRIITSIARAGGSDFAKIVGLTLLLGIWPGIEISFIQQAVNTLYDGRTADAIKTVLLMFSVGTAVIILFVLMPYLMQKAKDRIHRILLTRMFGVMEEKSLEELMRPNERNHIENTFRSLKDMYATGLDGGLTLLQTAVTALILCVPLFMIHPVTPLIIMGGVMLNVYFSQKGAEMERSYLQATSEDTRLEKNLFNHLTKLESAKELRVFGHFSWLLQKWEGHFQYNYDKTMKHTIQTSMIQMAASISSRIAITLVLMLGLRGLWLGEMKPGDMAALLMGGLFLDSLLAMMVQQGKYWLGRRFFLEPVLGEIEMKPTPSLSHAAESLYAVELSDVSFAYDSTAAPVLQHVSFRIPHGAKVAVVGPNGAGKTTLMNILTGLFTPTQGTCVITQPTSASFQKYGRYKMTIAENVYLGDITRQDDHTAVRFALEKAAADFVAGMPEREQTILWPELGGVNLSEGQWQKLAIARGLFRTMQQEGSVFIMDEPTSALDPETELALLQQVMDELQEQTVFFVVHRLVGCTFADWVMVIDQGQMIAYGTHEQLIQTCELYQQMWSASASFMNQNRGEADVAVPLS